MPWSSVTTFSSNCSSVSSSSTDEYRHRHIPLLDPFIHLLSSSQSQVTMQCPATSRELQQTRLVPAWCLGSQPGQCDWLSRTTADTRADWDECEYARPRSSQFILLIPYRLHASFHGYRLVIVIYLHLPYHHITPPARSPSASTISNRGASVVLAPFQLNGSAETGPRLCRLHSPHTFSFDLLSLAACTVRVRVRDERRETRDETRDERREERRETREETKREERRGRRDEIITTITQIPPSSSTAGAAAVQ